MQLLNSLELSIVHDATRVRHHLLKLVEFLLLEQEHHVISEDECVARTDVDSLLERHLRIFNV